MLKLDIRKRCALRMATVFVLFSCGFAHAQGVPDPGPDLTVSEIFVFMNWGVEKNEVGDDIRAYSFGTRACNNGTQPISWRAGTQQFPDPRHPVIAQNMYRLENGRFQQLGQSWVKHAFCAVDGDVFCGVCQDNNDCNFLAPGCSDPYSAGLNGDQLTLGPKSEINPTNGAFPVPPANPPFEGVVARRLQAFSADVERPGKSDARFFAEAQYISTDDALAGNDLNNASWREVALTPEGEVDAFVGLTQIGEPAVMIWQDAHPDVTITPIDLQNDGRFYLAHRVVQDGDEWSYHYAILNFNSFRSARGIAIPIPSNVATNDISFYAPPYHSSELFDNAPWSMETSGDELRFFGPEFADDQNGNALRWGTMYNFDFTSERPPRAVVMRLDIFRPFFFPSVTMPGVAPTPWEDVDLDGVVGPDDLMAVLDAWGAESGPADLDRNGVVDVFDLLALLRRWGG